MSALLQDDLDEKILGIADELADDFVADLEGAISKEEIRLALAGLQLTFLSKVTRLVVDE